MAKPAEPADKPESSDTSPFGRGMRAAWDGLRSAFGDGDVNRAYLRVVAGLFTLTLVLDVALLWLLFAQTAPTPDMATWAKVGLWAARVLGTVATFVAGPLLSIFVVNIVFPFFNQPVFLAGLKVVDSARAEALEASEGMVMWRSAANATRRLVVFLVLSLCCFALNLIPVIGSVVATVCQAWLTARTVGWELLDPYFDCIDMRYPEQKKLIREHRAVLLGFGLPLSLVLAIPVVGPLFFGLAQAAAGTFVAREIPVDPREGAAPKTS